MAATMKKSGVRWTGTLAWLVACMALGCSTVEPAHERACFSCDDQRLVRIVPFEKFPSDDQGRPFQHPFDLSQAEWETTVRSVMVRSVHRPLLGPSYRDAAEPLFLDEEVRYLGTSLRQALQQATAQEQVVFALARPSDAGVPQLTSGAWFIKAGRVHLHLANCRVAVTMPAIRRQIWIDPLFAQAGTFYEAVPGDHQQLVAGTREGSNPFRAAPVELAIEYRALNGSLLPPAPSKSSAASHDSHDLEERLALLKRLHEQGLITEEEYRMKKQQLLQQL